MALGQPLRSYFHHLPPQDQINTPRGIRFLGARSLLVDERGNRNGFPFLVVAELGALKDHYITVAFPKGSDVWNDAYAK